MKSFEYTVNDPIGIHASPAGLLVKEIKKYAGDHTITIGKDGKSTNGVKLMAIMAMSIKQGDVATVTVDGPDEENVATALEAYMKANL